MSDHPTSAAGGFTLIELLIVVTLIGILAALGAPFMLAAKASANEASAIGSLRAVNTAEANYSMTCGGGAYAVNIPMLISRQFLSPDMGFNPKSGFNFTVQAGDNAGAGPVDCQGDATVTTYYSTGRPVSSDSGKRAFASNQATVLWQDLSGAPPAEPFEAVGTISPIQ